jgi:hypothetical protein
MTSNFKEFFKSEVATLLAQGVSNAFDEAVNSLLYSD